MSQWSVSLRVNVDNGPPRRARQVVEAETIVEVMDNATIDGFTDLRDALDGADVEAVNEFRVIVRRLG